MKEKQGFRRKKTNSHKKRQTESIELPNVH